MKDSYFTDTEGCALPTDDGRPTFGVNLVADFHKAGEFYLSMSVPMYFETHDGQVYNSAGVLTTDARTLLQGYLDDALEDDEGASLRDFSALLRDFARRADELAEKISKESTPGAV